MLVERKRRNIYLSQGFFSIIKQQREMGMLWEGRRESSRDCGRLMIISVSSLLSGRFFLLKRKFFFLIHSLCAHVSSPESIHNSFTLRPVDQVDDGYKQRSRRRWRRRLWRRLVVSMGDGSGGTGQKFRFICMSFLAAAGSVRFFFEAAPQR